MDGIYTAYMTGQAGVSMALFVIKGNVIAGADVGGIKYDGILESSDRGYKCILKYNVPLGANLITGAAISQGPTEIPLSTVLPPDFWNGQIIPMQTPFGPINIRFEKIRGL